MAGLGQQSLDLQVGLYAIYHLGCVHTQPKVKRENFVSLSKANVGKTIALIGWQVSCVTSPAEIARLGLPNANDRISDGYNLPNVEERMLRVRSNWQWSKWFCSFNFKANSFN